MDEGSIMLIGLVQNILRIVMADGKNLIMQQFTVTQGKDNLGW